VERVRKIGPGRGDGPPPAAARGAEGWPAPPARGGARTLVLPPHGHRALASGRRCVAVAAGAGEGRAREADASDPTPVPPACCCSRSYRLCTRLHSPIIPLPRCCSNALPPKLPEAHATPSCPRPPVECVVPPPNPQPPAAPSWPPHPAPPHLWNVLYCSSKAKECRCVLSTWPARWLRMPAAMPSFWKGCAGPGGAGAQGGCVGGCACGLRSPASQLARPALAAA
jgi:hypothetical protein